LGAQYSVVEDGTYMIDIEGGDSDTSPAEGGYVVAVDGGYTVTCNILEDDAVITYDEYNQLAAGETITKELGTETWEFTLIYEEEYEIDLEV